MRKQLIGLLASVALVGAPALVYAQTDTSGQDQNQQPAGQTQGGSSTIQEEPNTSTSTQSTTTQSTQESQGTGGAGTAGTTDQGTSTQDKNPDQYGTGGSSTAGQTGSMGATAGMTEGQQELSGKVVKAEKHTLYIEQNGAIVPLHISSTTVYEGTGLKSLKDLKPGQDVRASFDVKNKTTNEAKKISLSGEGGAGLNETTPSQPGSSTGGTMNQGSTVPPEQNPGTGGSGTMGTQGNQPSTPGGTDNSGTMGSQPDNTNPSNPSSPSTPGSTGGSSTGGSSTGGSSSGGSGTAE